LLFAAVEQPIAQAAGSTMTAAAIFDMEALLSRVGGDRELMIDVIRLFLDDCPFVSRALRWQVEADNASALRAAAHALKGSAGSLSAMAVYDTASSLEQLAGENRLDAARPIWKRLLIDVDTFVAHIRPFDRAIIETRDLGRD